MRYKTKELTNKQRKFVDALFLAENATEAARMAGYKDTKLLKSLAHETKKNPKVKEAIEAKKKELEKEALLTKIEKLKMVDSVIVNSYENCDWGNMARMIKISNEMQGHNAPTEVTINAQESFVKRFQNDEDLNSE